ncbi:hypothetical protein [Bradyrhizobium sp. HKCCYLS20291]|uniref:hypothetical protein n=1 Tax=Bradyrhizobium sp. HKCCYLS20291 TaxID=3420766 RepID=UPI003EB9A7A1
MAGLLFLLALLAGGAGVAFYNARDLVSIGENWAVAVCSSSKLFCVHPDYLFYTAGVLLVLAMGVKLGSAMSGN